MTRRSGAIRRKPLRWFRTAVPVLGPVVLVFLALVALWLFGPMPAQAAPSAASDLPAISASRPAAYGGDAPATVAGAAEPAASAASATAEASSGEDTSTSLLYFVYLGDIWRYEAQSGRAELVVSFEGNALGHPSWSLDDAGLAWEERFVVDGGRRTRIVFRAPATLPGGPPTTWTVDGGSSPAVSPDGRYVLYHTLADGVSSLHVLDAGGQPVLSLQGAGGGTWVSSSTGEEPILAFNRDEGVFPANSGFSLFDLETGQESVVSGPNVWGPQAGSGGSSFLVTRAEEGGDRVDIVLIEGDAATSVLEVTNNEAFDYRWSLGEQGEDSAFVELVPMGGGRSDVYRLIDCAGKMGPELMLTGASFGWNASLPAASPFSDLGFSDAHCQAAVLLREYRVLDGFGDHTFRASSPVKRAQFTKMVTGALGVAVYEGLPLTPFVDLGQRISPLYPHEYVSAARHYDLVRGYPGGAFRPWGQISRMQAVSMIVRAAGVYLPERLPTPPEDWVGVTSSFSHQDHGSNVHRAEYDGLLAGIDLTGWDLAAPTTRGEAAQLLFNLLRLHGPLYAPDSLPGVSSRPAGTSVGIVPVVARKNPIGEIVFDGDSLTAGSTASDPYPSQLMRRFRAGPKWVNLGIGGQRLEDMLRNAPANVDRLFDAGRGQNLVVIWGGTNDMRHWSHTAEAVYSRLKEYCLDRRARGFIVVVLTTLPRSDGDCAPSFETRRQTLNRKIRATWPAFADALVDVGADRLIGWQGDEVDARFFSGDRVHLNNGGLSVVAGRVGRILKQIDEAGGP